MIVNGQRLRYPALEALVVSQGRIIEQLTKQLQEFAGVVPLAAKLEQALDEFCEITVCDGMPEGAYCAAPAALWDAWIERVCTGRTGRGVPRGLYSVRRRELYDAWDLYQGKMRSLRPKVGMEVPE